MRIGTEGEDIADKISITAIVNLPRHPLHRDKLVIGSIEAYINTGYSPRSMFRTFFGVDMNIDEAEQDTLEEMLVDWLLHSSLFL